jgi:hypothetical protein
LQESRETVGITGFSACSFADLFCIFLHYSAKKYTDVHKNGRENGFLYIRFPFHFHLSLQTAPDTKTYLFLFTKK